MGKIIVKRIYEELPEKECVKVLVDRLWPRGIAKSKVDVWYKDMAPSKELRQWFHHEPEKYETFRQKYMEELENNSKKETFKTEIQKILQGQDVYLLYGAKDTQHNNAVVLCQWLEEKR